MPVPILLLSDAPTANTGLGRICRDLSTRVHAHLSDVFTVATLGYAGPGSKNLGFQQYSIQSRVTDNGWFVPELKDVWEDFAGGERGIVMTIWDPSRLAWFATPSAKTCVEPLASWLSAAPFERWGYFPVDATGPNDKLTAQLGETIKGYDRGICYSKWAEKIVSETIGSKDSERMRLTSLPHGIDTSVFVPRGKMAARQNFRDLGFFGLTDGDFLVGMVATNQARKDFGLGFSVCAELLRAKRDVRVWIHTDTVKRHWDLVALATDFGLLGRIVITTHNFSDEQMSWLYSACDVTLGIGLGEGFGYPIFESLACGVPCVHGAYGGAVEHLPKSMTLKVFDWRLEGQFNCVRPVFNAELWADNARSVAETNALFPPTLDWNALWPEWEQWFREGASK